MSGVQNDVETNCMSSSKVVYHIRMFEIKGNQNMFN